MDVELVKAIAAELCLEKGWGEPVYIDNGASGVVFSVEHPTLGQVALKTYDPKFFEGEHAVIEDRRLELQQELIGLDHPNLIRTLEVARCDKRKTWYLLLDFCPWPSLQKLVSDVPDDRVASLIKQLADVTIFLKENGIIHRDIKPANISVSPDFSSLILLDLGVLRRIDFVDGIGTDINEKRRFVATAQYSPPEYIPRQEPAGETGFDALNVYQVGAVLHDLIMKRPLFNDEAESLNRYILYSAVVNKVPTVFNAALPARIISLCRSALLKDPLKRVSAISLRDFTQDVDSPEDVRKRLAQQKRSRPAPAPISTLPWLPKVRSWISAAAVLEKTVLGPHRLSVSSKKEVHVLTLRFDEHGVSVHFVLKWDAEDGLIGLTLEPSDGATKTTILQIGPEGIDVPEDQIVPQIREHLLYALDSLPPLSEEG